MGWHCKRDLRITLGKSKALLNGGLFCCLFVMNLNVKSLFDQAAQDYDCTRRQFIPCFDAFYGSALVLLPERQGLRVLDVGAGTGLLSGLIRAQRPDSHLTLADVSEAMLAKAQQRFTNDAQVDYQVADFAHNSRLWSLSTCICHWSQLNLAYCVRHLYRLCRIGRRCHLSPAN